MQLLIDLGALFLCYLFGSIPFGLLIVRAMTGKDIRQVESGRTGGTNAMRAAGFWAGLFTAILDIVKGAATIWVVRWFGNLGWLSHNYWLEVLAGVAGILGHNHSIFLPERTPEGRFRLRGGAGGAAALGGSLGLWAPSVLFIFPIGVLIYYFVGYASVTTLSVAFLSIIVFGVRAALGLGPWEYAIYGVIALGLLAWALRPNLKRLREGTERLHGFRARRRNPPAADAEKK